MCCLNDQGVTVRGSLSGLLQNNSPSSYLEGGPLMWMLPLYLHVNQKSDYDDDMMKDIYAYITAFSLNIGIPQLLNYHTCPEM